MSNENEKKLFVVETVSMFKLKYVIRAKSLEHAYDSVVCDAPNDISQQHLDEIIFSGKEISEQEYLEMYQIDKNMNYMNSWSDDKKLEQIHEINYDI